MELVPILHRVQERSVIGLNDVDLSSVNKEILKLCRPIRSERGFNSASRSPTNFSDGFCCGVKINGKVAAVKAVLQADKGNAAGCIEQGPIPGITKTCPDRAIEITLHRGSQTRAGSV